MYINKSRSANYHLTPHRQCLCNQQ